jgi:hypothetical protein
MGRKITLPEAPPAMAAREREQKSALVEVENKSPNTSHNTKIQPSSKEDFSPGVEGKSDKILEALDTFQSQQRGNNPFPVLIWTCFTIIAGFVITYLLAPPIHRPVDLGIPTNDQVQIPQTVEQKLPGAPTQMQTPIDEMPLYSEPKKLTDNNSKNLHKWTNAEGLVIEATFEGLEGKDHVLLRLPTGTLHKYPLNKLSAISRNLALNNGEPKLWKWENQQGKIVEASFEGLDGVDYLLLGLTNGQTHKYPIENLSPESQKLALRLAAMLEASSPK